MSRDVAMAASKIDALLTELIQGNQAFFGVSTTIKANSARKRHDIEPFRNKFLGNLSTLVSYCRNQGGLPLNLPELWQATKLDRTHFEIFEKIYLACFSVERSLAVEEFRLALWSQAEARAWRNWDIELARPPAPVRPRRRTFSPLFHRLMNIAALMLFLVALVAAIPAALLLLSVLTTFPLSILLLGIIAISCSLVSVLTLTVGAAVRCHESRAELQSQSRRPAVAAPRKPVLIPVVESLVIVASQSPASSSGPTESPHSGSDGRRGSGGADDEHRSVLVAPAVTALKDQPRSKSTPPGRRAGVNGTGRGARIFARPTPERPVVAATTEVSPVSPLPASPGLLLGLGRERRNTVATSRANVANEANEANVANEADDSGPVIWRSFGPPAMRGLVQTVLPAASATASVPVASAAEVSAMTLR